MMPTDDRLGLHDEERLFPSRSVSPQHNLEDAVRCSELRPRTLLGQERKLLAQSQVFEDKVAAGSKEPSSRCQKQRQQPRHGPILASNSPLRASSVAA